MKNSYEYIVYGRSDDIIRVDGPSGGNGIYGENERIKFSNGVTVEVVYTIDGEWTVEIIKSVPEVDILEFEVGECDSCNYSETVKIISNKPLDYTKVDSQ